MPKNIAIFLDGTCDSYSTQSPKNSNVGRLYEAALNDGTNQVKIYSDGVGASNPEHFLSAATGYGVDVRIQRGYKALVDWYADGDAIHLFGFSRGAFEARSLAGMLRHVGLIRNDGAVSTTDAYLAYMHRKSDPNGAAAFKAAHSRAVTVKFIGVWDTVEAIGIPVPMTLATVGAPDFHDPEIGPDIENAVHALSIDEERTDFKPTYFDPALATPGQLTQVYFPGVHSDVGGGYDDDHLLADITLAWMATNAVAKGLLLADTSVTQCSVDACYGTLHNSMNILYEPRGHFHRVVDGNARISIAAKKRLDDAAGQCRPCAYAPVNVDKSCTTYEWVG